MCCCSKQPVRGEKTSDPRTGCVGDYILPSFSTFLERIVYNRLLNYIDKNKILCDSQYGFRKKHSTSLALIDIYDKIFVLKTSYLLYCK